MTLKAHFDGQQVILDEPCDLPPNTQLMVTVLSPAAKDRAEWNDLSTRGLARAYSAFEPEYSATDSKAE